jgi:hypothetical protein
MAAQDIIVDEDLPNFFEAVMLSQADEIVMEARNVKKSYGIEIIDPITVDRLDAT